MKKFIPLIIFVLIMVTGGVIKRQLFVSPPNFLSEVNLNTCLQSLLILPMGIFGGGVLLIFPRRFIGWLESITNSRAGRVNQHAIVFFGAIIFVSTIFSIQFTIATCKLIGGA
jgi:hypothetical protein